MYFRHNNIEDMITWYDNINEHNFVTCSRFIRLLWQHWSIVFARQKKEAFGRDFFLFVWFYFGFCFLSCVAFNKVLRSICMTQLYSIHYLPELSLISFDLYSNECFLRLVKTRTNQNPEFEAHVAFHNDLNYDLV